MSLPRGDPRNTPPASEATDLQQLIDEASLGLLRLDRRLIIQAANAAAHRLLERRPGTLVGRTAMEAFVDHRMEDVIRRAMAADGGSAASAGSELRVGRDRVVVLRARGTAGGAWIALEDVTELRRLQRIRAEFIDNLSHELRTPLSTIRLLTETLAADMERVDGTQGATVTPRMRDRVAKIDVETGHLVQMVTELLDLARMEQASTDLTLARVSLERVMRGAVERLRAFAERQGVVLELEEPAGGYPTINADEERIGQLLVNLLHNAVKFSSPGGAVSARVASAPRSVTISVEDHGIGIPRADLDRVFERFYKVDKARTRGGGGTGLGLSIARHIAEGHGGRIWVESEEGRGSTFSVEIPMGEGGA